MKKYPINSFIRNILGSYASKTATFFTLIGLVATMFYVVSNLYDISVGYKFLGTTIFIGSVYAVLFFTIRFHLTNSLNEDLTLATLITVSRGFLSVVATGLAVTAVGIPETETIGWIVGILFGISGLFDLADGWVARNKSKKTELGSRMDIETDSMSTLFGSIIVVMNGLVSPFFLLVGLARYIYLIYFSILHGDTNPEDNGEYQWLNQSLFVLVFSSMSISMLPLLEPNLTRVLLSTIGFAFVANFLRSLLASRPN